jgi:hypothetical protein
MEGINAMTDWMQVMVGITRDYAKANGIDMGRAVPNEKHSCSNCHHVGPLNMHGNCEACGSAAVQSWEVINGGSHAER